MDQQSNEIRLTPDVLRFIQGWNAWHDGDNRVYQVFGYFYKDPFMSAFGVKHMEHNPLHHIADLSNTDIRIWGWVENLNTYDMFNMEKDKISFYRLSRTGIDTIRITERLYSGEKEVQCFYQGKCTNSVFFDALMQNLFPTLLKPYRYAKLIETQFKPIPIPATKHEAIPGDESEGSASPGTSDADVSDQ